MARRPPFSEKVSSAALSACPTKWSFETAVRSPEVPLHMSSRAGRPIILVPSQQFCILLFLVGPKYRELNAAWSL